jgi:hypothetical protein
MSSKISEQQLLARLAGLPREIPPANDPWDRIASRLGQERAASRKAPTAAWRHPRRMLQAVAAVAVLGIAAVLFMGPQVEQVQPGAERIVLEKPGMPTALAGSEAEYRAAFREFIPLGEAKPDLSAMTVETIETGWADLRQVELELAGALARDPADPFLNKRMLELRARQLGFLRQLAALDRSNRRLTI